MSEWTDELSGLLGSYFSDWSVDEGVEQLLFVSSDHPEYHQRFLETLEQGLRAADQHDERVVPIVNAYYLVSNLEDARAFLQQIVDVYQRQYREAHD